MSKSLKPILLTGVTALVIAGGITVASTSSNLSAASLTEDRVKEIVKTYIQENPKDIIDALQNWQRTEEANRVKNQQAAVFGIKDKIKAMDHLGEAGNPKGDVTIVEFFDYNCPACKMMFESIDALLKEDKNVHVLFVEYPIFGPQSDENAKIGSAIAHIAPEKYFDFHTGMMRNKGKADAAYAYDIAKGLGIDVAKLKEEAAKESYNEMLQKDRDLGNSLHIQGTPAAIINDTMVNSALSLEDLKGQVSFARAPKK